jgi:hypothetical protein
MAELSRVPAPHSPFEGRSGKIVALVVVGIALAIAKPWNPPPSAQPQPSVVPIAAAATAPPAAVHRYDPAVFGSRPPEPTWEVWPGSATADGPSRFAAPPDAVAPPSAGPSGGFGAQEATPTIGGPVIDLGSSDDLTAIGINHPAGVDLVAVRLWRFRDGDEPERIQLTEQPTPWPRAEMRVFVVRDARLPKGQVLRWRPGLYRLDLLADPADRIRSLVLNVQAGQIALPPEPGGVEHDAVDVGLLRRLPTAATFWSYGTYLSGWADRDPVGHCRVAELWRAWKLGDVCHPIPVGRPLALGVNLPVGTAVSEIRLREIDPLPGHVAVVERTDVANRPGLAYVGLEAGVLGDGIYELAVETAAGDLRWYVEVSAHGIAWGS